MNQTMKSTTYDFMLEDGATVKLTLNFFYLYQLKNNNKELYDRYNKIMTTMDNKHMDIIDMVTIIYTGYVCANLGKEDLLSEEDFYLLCGSDMNKVAKAMKALVTPKN